MPRVDRVRTVVDRRRLGVPLAVLATAALVLVAALTLGAGDPRTQVVVPEPTTPVAAQTFFVSPAGDDGGSGAAEDPWGTLGHALAQLRPGDRLTVADGRYEEDIDLRVTPGRREAPVHVAAADGARPVVVGLLWLEDLSWWDIRGLNVTWHEDNHADQHMVKLTDGIGWRFADAELWDARSFAALLVAGRPEDYTLSGLYVHDTHPANDTNQDHLVYLNSGKGGGVLERSILANSRNGRGVKVGPPDEGEGGVADVVIRYVTMVDNRGPSNVQLAYDVSRVVIERCLLVGSAPGRANVTAFELEGEGNVVHNTLGWESAALLAEAEGLISGRGNVQLDPRLSGPGGARPYEPMEERARVYGRWAPGA